MAQSIFETMLKEAGVTVIYSAQVTAVNSTRSRISSITIDGGKTLSSAFFIDASYEGDLMARAGVSYTIGRESRGTFNESLAGLYPARSNQFSLAVDPFDSATGEPLKFSTLPRPRQALGEGDKVIQSYNFRLCVTQNASNRAPFPQPKGYNTSDWELLRRYIVACESLPHGRRQCQIGVPSCNNARVPNGKYDMNNCGGFASDFIGGSWSYPEATYPERREIWRQHLAYQQGLLYFLANDSPRRVRDAMSEWGLCADEFRENELAPHWPPALYVRAARRLVGERTFTQNTPTENHAAGDIGDEAIAIGGYNFDSHNGQRWACRNSSACSASGPPGIGRSTAFAWNEGNVEIRPPLYQIPVWVMMPKEADAVNLLVVAAPSASHVGMSTLRMEPQFMMLGHAAGTAVALANRERTTVQAIPLPKLNGLLREQRLVTGLPVGGASTVSTTIST